MTIIFLFTSFTPCCSTYLPNKFVYLLLNESDPVDLIEEFLVFGTISSFFKYVQVEPVVVLQDELELIWLDWFDQAFFDSGLVHALHRVTIVVGGHCHNHDFWVLRVQLQKAILLCENPL